MKMNKQTFTFAGILALGFSLSGCFDGGKGKEDVMVNFTPTATSINVITQTEVAITDQLTGSDSDSDSIEFLLDQGPTLGMVSITSSGSFTYQPFDEVTGSDSFSFFVRDSDGATARATVGITIEALQVSFLTYSRAAFNASETNTPLAINGREFIQDVASQADYQDLIDSGSQ